MKSSKKMEPLRFTVVIEEERLREAFLADCVSQERDMASEVRFILKQFFFGRGQNGAAQLSQGGSLPPIPHLADHGSELESQEERNG